MNVLMVTLTLAVLAATLVSCAVLGSDRFGPLQKMASDGLDAPGPERGPLEHDVAALRRRDGSRRADAEERAS